VPDHQSLFAVGSGHRQINLHSPAGFRWIREDRLPFAVRRVVQRAVDHDVRSRIAARLLAVRVTVPEDGEREVKAGAG
jgi:hypothetical protein